MRLAIITRNYAEYCLRYANAASRSAEVLLVVDEKAARNEWSGHDAQASPGLTVVRTDLGIRRGINGLLTAIRAVIGFRPDFAHFQEAPNLTTPMLMLALRPFTRLILTVHDPCAHSGADSRLTFIQHWLTILGRRLADLIVVHGEYNDRLYTKTYPRHRNKVIRSQHGVLMAPASDRSLREPRTILMFGRMQRYKGLETLIEASDILSKRAVRHKVIVAGTGPEADRLLHEMQCRKNFELRRRYILPCEAAYLFECCDIVALPYIDATQSGVAAAALANGKVVVASRAGGLSDVIDDGVNGLLVEPGSAVSLAGALQQVLGDENLRLRLMAGACETAATKLDWSRIADELITELHNRAMPEARDRSHASALINE